MPVTSLTCCTVPGSGSAQITARSSEAKQQDGFPLTSHRSLLTKEWYRAPVIDCRQSGVETRTAGVVAGPSSLVSIAGAPDENDANQAGTRFGAFAVVGSIVGRTEIIERFLLGRFHNTFSLRDDRLVQVCEHCEESRAPDVIRSPIMNGFVRLGQRRLLVNERILLFSPAVVQRCAKRLCDPGQRPSLARDVARQPQRRPGRDYSDDWKPGTGLNPAAYGATIVILLWARARSLSQGSRTRRIPAGNLGGEPWKS